MANKSSKNGAYEILVAQKDAITKITGIISIPFMSNTGTVTMVPSCNLTFQLLGLSNQVRYDPSIERRNDFQDCNFMFTKNSGENLEGDLLENPH